MSRRRWSPRSRISRSSYSTSQSSTISPRSANAASTGVCAQCRRCCVAAEDDEWTIVRPAGEDQFGLLGERIGEDVQLDRIGVLLVLAAARAASIKSCSWVVAGRGPAIGGVNEGGKGGDLESGLVVRRTT